MNPEIKFEKPRPQYKLILLEDMKAGMVVVNGVYNPNAIIHNAGLYVVLRDARSVFMTETLFMINLRSGKQYTYAQIKRRWSENALVGGWLCELRSINVALVLAE